MHLFTACGDHLVRCFDLKAPSGANSKPELVLDGHVSVPRALLPTPDGKWLVTAGRDSVILVWDLNALFSTGSGSKSSKKGKQKASENAPYRTIVAQERIEGASLLQPNDLSQWPGEVRVAAGGEKGVVKVWDALSGKELGLLGSDRPQTSTDDQHQILGLDYNVSSATIASVHADQNVIFYSLTTGSTYRQVIGFNDEIVDATFLPSASGHPQQLAVATNSALIRVYSTGTGALDAHLLSAHTDIVLCVASTSRNDGPLLVSGSKDRMARLWTSDSDGGWSCVASCEGHAESIGALALSRRGKFMFTGSQDRTIKMWDLATLGSSSDITPVKLTSMTTQKAHDKDINALDVSPNDALLASGSQDKAVKVFSVTYAEGKRGEIKLAGICKGHKRGVWTVKFGRTERVLATGSGDKTVRLWSLDDFSCVKVSTGPVVQDL